MTAMTGNGITAEIGYPNQVSDLESEGLPGTADDDSTAYDEVESGRWADGPNPAALPAGRPQAVSKFGTTAEEQRAGWWSGRRAPPVLRHRARASSDPFILCATNRAAAPRRRRGRALGKDDDAAARRRNEGRGRRGTATGQQSRRRRLVNPGRSRAGHQHRLPVDQHRNQAPQPGPALRVEHQILFEPAT